jgi:uncharacterized protein (UPF0335 family)
LPYPQNVETTPADAAAAAVEGVAANQLRSFVERIERLEEEKKAIGEDIKEVYSEAKGTGFDTKILKKIVALRKKDPEEIDEEQALLDVYKRALGMAPDIAADETRERTGQADLLNGSTAPLHSAALREA